MLRKFANVLVFSAMPISSAGFAAADVLRCVLNPNVETGYVSASMAVYNFKGVVHSIFVEAQTDYGDHLPYLFSCGVNCVMRLPEDGAEYFLVLEPDAQSPITVTIKTVSNDQSFKSTDIFSASQCRVFAIQGSGE